jgi:hypothetical protein
MNEAAFACCRIRKAGELTAAEIDDACSVWVLKLKISSFTALKDIEENQLLSDMTRRVSVAT